MSFSCVADFIPWSKTQLRYLSIWKNFSEPARFLSIYQRAPWAHWLNHAPCSISVLPVFIICFYHPPTHTFWESGLPFTHFQVPSACTQPDKRRCRTHQYFLLQAFGSLMLLYYRVTPHRLWEAKKWALIIQHAGSTKTSGLYLACCYFLVFQEQDKKKKSPHWRAVSVGGQVSCMCVWGFCFCFPL